MIIQKIHLASRFFIRTVCGSPAMQSCSLHPPDAVHGFGCSQQVFCRAKMVFVYTKTLLATTMKPLNALPSFENHFAIETVHFQVQLEADGYFSVQEIFAFATVASRASRYHLASFEPDFLQIQLQNTCWASPKPDIPHKTALTVHLIL